MVGTGPSSPRIYNLHGTHSAKTVEITTEFLWMQSITNEHTTEKGVKGYVQRLD